LIQVPPSAERLVAFVALSGRTLTRQHVAGSLWPDTPEQRAGANLRSSLWRLRNGGCPVIASTSRWLEMRGEIVLDVDGLVSLTWACLDAASEPSDREVATLAMAADLLPGWSDDWVVVERERLRQLRVHSLERVCEKLTAIGRFGAAVEAGLAAIRDEPLRESAQTVLIRAHLAEGNASEALVRFHRYWQLLRTEMGIEPSREFADLLDEIPVGPGSRRRRMVGSSGRAAMRLHEEPAPRAPGSLVRSTDSAT
jgi:DNA-binding SARP family transcriptional activator